MLWRNIQFPWTWTSGHAPPPIPVIAEGGMLHIRVPEAIILQDVALPTTESQEFVIPSKGVYLTWSVTFNNPTTGAVIELDAALKEHYFSFLDRAIINGLRNLVGGFVRIKVVINDNPDLVAITVRVIVRSKKL